MDYLEPRKMPRYVSVGTNLPPETALEFRMLCASKGLTNSVVLKRAVMDMLAKARAEKAAALARQNENEGEVA